MVEYCYELASNFSRFTIAGTFWRIESFVVVSRVKTVRTRELARATRYTHVNRTRRQEDKSRWLLVDRARSKRYRCTESGNEPLVKRSTMHLPRGIIHCLYFSTLPRHTLRRFTLADHRFLLSVPYHVLLTCTHRVSSFCIPRTASISILSTLSASNFLRFRSSSSILHRPKRREQPTSE